MLIEAMSYRLSHHSTSDDSSAYRSREEVGGWEKGEGGIARFRKFLEARKLWNEEMQTSESVSIRKEILKAFAAGSFLFLLCS